MEEVFNSLSEKFTLNISFGEKELRAKNSKFPNLLFCGLFTDVFRFFEVSLNLKLSNFVSQSKVTIECFFSVFFLHESSWSPCVQKRNKGKIHIPIKENR